MATKKTVTVNTDYPLPQKDGQVAIVHRSFDAMRSDESVPPAIRALARDLDRSHANPAWAAMWLRYATFVCAAMAEDAAAAEQLQQAARQVA